MFELKPLSPDAIPAALAKAERYRLLNEPGRGREHLPGRARVDPENQEALVTLLLALTDQFGTGRWRRAMAAAERRGRDAPRRLQARVLLRHHPRAAREGAAPQRSSRLTSLGARVAPRSDDLVRAGRSHPAGRQRRCAAAVERVRADSDGPAGNRARHPGVPQRPIGMTDPTGIRDWISASPESRVSFTPRARRLQRGHVPAAGRAFGDRHRLFRPLRQLRGALEYLHRHAVGTASTPADPRTA